MAGMSRHTGQVIERPEHIKQSIEVILTTAVGTREMRRSLGFDVLNEDGKPKPNLTQEIVEKSARTVLTENEPRIVVDGVSATFEEGQRLRQVVVSYRDKNSNQSDQAAISY